MVTSEKGIEKMRNYLMKSLGSTAKLMDEDIFIGGQPSTKSPHVPVSEDILSERGFNLLITGKHCGARLVKAAFGVADALTALRYCATMLTGQGNRIVFHQTTSRIVISTSFGVEP